MYDQFYASKARKTVWHCSRRLGKSAAALVIGMEHCIRKTDCIVRYGAATQKDVKEIIHPLMGILTATCPEDIRPYWNQSEGKYFFPGKKSFMVVSGLDEGRADNLRGTYMDLGILDEAAFVDDLQYAVRDVLMPQLLTTDGHILFASTSPKTPAHAFVDYMLEAQTNDAYLKMTIHEDSRPEVIARIPEWMKEAGGEDSTTWKREYLCEIITDEESAIVPEFAKPEIRARVIQELERPPHFIPYTVVDLGLIDFTAAVFGYVDFKRGKKVILDEFLVNRKDSKFITDAIFTKENQIWGDYKAHPVRRYFDGPALTVQDINSIHEMECSLVASEKDELDAMVNELRLDCMTGILQIHPRAKETAKQLQYGIWDKAHRKFDRSSTYGHFDLLAATMYFVRLVSLRENPYPENWGLDIHTHLIHKSADDSYTKEAIKGAFGLK